MVAKKDAVEPASSTEVDTNTGEMIELDFNPRSWADVEAALGDVGGLVEWEGSFYEVVSKDALIDQPFLITDIRVNPNGQFGEFVSVCALLKDDTAIVFNDGSTGVARQAKDLLASGRKAGVIIPKGLRVSEYEYVPRDFDGQPIGGTKPIPAKTYYFQ